MSKKKTAIDFNINNIGLMIERTEDLTTNIKNIRVFVSKDCIKPNRLLTVCKDRLYLDGVTNPLEYLKYDSIFADGDLEYNLDKFDEPIFDNIYNLSDTQYIDKLPQYIDITMFQFSDFENELEQKELDRLVVHYSEILNNK